MSIRRPVRPADNQSAVTEEMEGEIQQAVRKATSHAPVAKSSESFASGVSDAVLRIAAMPMAEIDRLIGELTQLRSQLQGEAKRVEGEIARVESEIAGYTQTSEAAMQSIQAIDQSLGHFKRIAGLRAD